MSSEDCGPAAPKFPYGLSLCILIQLFFDDIAVHPSAFTNSFVPIYTVYAQ